MKIKANMMRTVFYVNCTNLIVKLIHLFFKINNALVIVKYILPLILRGWRGRHMELYEGWRWI